MESSLFWSVIIVNGLLSFVVASVARQRGRDPISFWALSFFLSFLIAILVLMALPVEPANQAPSHPSDGDQRERDLLRAQCPFCKEEIRSDATVCKHCRQTVTPTYEERRAALESAELEQAAEAQQAAIEEAARAREAAIERAVKSRENAERRKAKFQKRKPLIITVAISVLSITAGVVIAVPLIRNANDRNAISARFESAVESCSSKDKNHVGNTATTSASGPSLTISGTADFQMCFIKVLEPRWSYQIGAQTVNNPYLPYKSPITTTYLHGGFKYTYALPEGILTITRAN